MSVAVDETGNRSIRIKVIVALAVFVAVFGIARFHMIVGGDLSVPVIVKKQSLGFSETLIDMDKVVGMPRIFAYAQFPIGVKVLQQEGMIETEEEFDARIEREYDEKYGDMERDVEESVKALDQAAEAAIEAADAAIEAGDTAVAAAGDALTAEAERADAEHVAPEEDRQAAIDAYTQELQLLQEFDTAVGAGDAPSETDAPRE